jgi:hypothetical protein
MHGPNEFNILHAINLLTTNINLCLVALHPKIVMQTFHSQLHEQFDHRLLTLFSQFTHYFHKWLTQQQ